MGMGLDCPNRREGQGNLIWERKLKQWRLKHSGIERPPAHPCSGVVSWCGVSAGSGCALVATDRAFRMRGFEGARVCVMNNEA